MTGSASSSSSSSSPSEPRKALSKIACDELQKELKKWHSKPPTGFELKDTDNLQRWVIEFNGAPKTLYANETYQLQFDFPENYPVGAPQVIFISPAPVHPRIYSNGHICLGFLDSWPRDNIVQSTCDMILSMLSNATMKQRPFDNDRYVSKCERKRSNMKRSKSPV